MRILSFGFLISLRGLQSPGNKPLSGETRCTIRACAVDKGEETPMKRLIVVACWFSIFGAGWCFGNPQKAKLMPGGSTWKVVQESERQVYVIGFMHGYVLGKRDAGALALAKLTEGKLPLIPPMTSAQKKDMEEGIAEAQKAGPVIERTSALILTAAMSTFYYDGQNTSVCWEDAIMLSAASLAGNPATDLELDAARKKGAESGCN